MSASRDKKMRQNAPAASEAATKAMTQQEKDRKKYKTKVVIISVILVVFVVATLFLSSKALYNKFTAVSFDDQDFTACDIAFYKGLISSQYYSAYGDYAQYYMPDDATITSNALELMKTTAAIYVSAQKAGHEISEENQQMIDSYLTSAESSAKSNNFDSVDGFLAANYCKGMTAKVYRDIVTYYVYSSSFSSDYYNGLTYTDEELEAYYEENADTLDYFKYSLFSFTTDDYEDPKAEAESFLKELEGGADFGELAYKYATDENKSSYEDATSCTGTTSGSSLSADSGLGEFLLDSSRVANDAAVIEGTADENGDITTYSVAQFLERNDNKYYTVSFRHILITPDSVSEDDYSTDEEYEAAVAEAKATAKEEADMYYALWKEDASEDNFVTMVSQYSEDTGSNESGGLYEDVYMGQMLTGVNDWIFDANRNTGDSGVVETSAGYHIMYFVGQSDTLYRTELAESGIRSDDYSAWETEQIGDGFAVSTHPFFYRLALKNEE